MGVGQGGSECVPASGRLRRVASGGWLWLFCEQYKTPPAERRGASKSERVSGGSDCIREVPGNAANAGNSLFGYAGQRPAGIRWYRRISGRGKLRNGQLSGEQHPRWCGIWCSGVWRQHGACLSWRSDCVGAAMRDTPYRRSWCHDLWWTRLYQGVCRTGTGRSRSLPWQWRRAADAAGYGVLQQGICT